MTSPSHLIYPNLHFIICMRVRHSLKFSFAQNPTTGLGFPLCWMLVVLYVHQLSEAKRNDFRIEITLSSRNYIFSKVKGNLAFSLNYQKVIGVRVNTLKWKKVFWSGCQFTLHLKESEYNARWNMHLPTRLVFFRDLHRPQIHRSVDNRLLS